MGTWIDFSVGGSSSSGTAQTVASVAALAGHTYTAALGTGLVHAITMDASPTFAAPSVGGVATGSVVTFSLKQDATGGRAPTWNAAFRGVSRYLPRQGPSQVSRADFGLNADGTLTLLSFDGIDLAKPLSPLDWGAVGDGVTDDTTAVLACLAYAKAQTVPLPVLLDAKFNVTQPPVLDTTGMKVTALNRYTTGLVHNSGYCGPTLLVAPNSNSWPALPTRTALATGSGVAMDLDGTDNYFINFCDDPQFKMDGLAAFCVEFFLKLDTDPASTSNIISMQGRSFPYASGIVKTFQIYANAATVYGGPVGKWSPTITCTIGGATKNIIPGFAATYLNTGTTYHCALTYDGTTLRFYAGVPGGTAVLQGSVAASGTLTSSPRQDCTVGASAADWPEQTTDAAMVDGAIDSIRISSTARYTSAYTAPTAKLSRDANTLILHNFSNEQRYFSVASSQSNGLALWMPVRRTDNGGGLISDITVQDVLLQCNYNTGGGLQAYACTNLLVERIRATTIGRAGIRIDNNCFKAHVRDCDVSAGNGSGIGARFGILVGSACGVSEVGGCDVTGFLYQSVGTGGVGAVFRHIDFEPSTGTLYSLLLLSPDATMDGTDATATVEDVFVDDEGADANYVAGALVQNMDAVEFKGGNFDVSTVGHASAAVAFDGGRLYSFQGTAFASNATATPFFTIVAAPQERIVVLPGRRYKTVAPWCSDLTKVLVLEKGQLQGLQTLAMSRTTVADAPYTVLTTDAVVAYTSLTAGRAVTLPAASSVATGQKVVVKDEAGTAGANNLTVSVSGGGTIDGAASKVINSNYGVLRFYSNGTQWFTE
jgi:hypothetical protein